MKPVHITVIAISIFVLAACTPKMANKQNRPLNIELIDKKGNLILLGKCTRERLAQPPFDVWYTKNFAAYTVDSTTANQIKPLLKNKQFLLFMGTWCGDSRREVPRMYKILDYCKVSSSQIQLITLNNSDTAYKQSPGHEERGLNIRRVPTLLIFENQREVGRVVESPVTSLEKDILAIVTGQPYEHRYKDPGNPKPAM
jgi:thiol-disulfide isomerase/thioredoxin